MSILNKKVGDIFRELVSADLKNRLNESSDVILINYRNLKSSEMTKLRKNLKAVGASVLVTKNSFMKKVFADLEKPAEVEKLLDGPTALVFVKEDLITASKALISFNKETEALKISGGFLSQRVITAEDVKKISSFSSRSDLYQQVAGVLNAPITNLAASLNQIITKVVYALKAVSDQKK
ncbi:MAG: 50S ribosomal protein L10 [Candidatus Omnitrophota bacterium]